MPTWLSTPVQRYRAVLILVLAILIFLVLRVAFTALIPFFLGALLAYLLIPLVDAIDRNSPKFIQTASLSRKFAIALVFFIVIGLVTGMLAFFIPALSTQAAELAQVFPDYVEQIDRLFAIDVNHIMDRIPEAIRDSVEQGFQDAIGLLAETIRRGIEGTLVALWQTVSFILGMLIVPIWVVYILNDSDSFRRGFYRAIPESLSPDVRNIVRILDDLLSSYLRGQLLLMFIVGVLSMILLLIFNINLALLLGTFAGIFEIIPFLGPFIGAIPAVLIAFLRSPLTALWVALGFLAIQQIENLFLSPRIRGNAVRFHPAIIMILVVVGSEVAGLWGVLLAVPVAAVIRDVFSYLYLRTTERGATPDMAMESFRSRNL